MNNKYRYEKLEIIEKHLQNYGIEIQDENGYKPFNEVLIDISEVFKRHRFALLNDREFEEFKLNLLRPIVGARYINQWS